MEAPLISQEEGSHQTLNQHAFDLGLLVSRTEGSKYLLLKPPLTLWYFVTASWAYYDISGLQSRLGIGKCGRLWEFPYIYSPIFPLCNHPTLSQKKLCALHFLFPLPKGGNTDVVVASVMRMTQPRAMVLNQGQCDPPATFQLEMSEDTFECWKRGRSSGAAAWGGREQGCYYGSYSAQDAPTAQNDPSPMWAVLWLRNPSL